MKERQLLNQASAKPKLALNGSEYLEMPGLNVMLAQDYYPESHQGGVSIVQNGLRVATNGDLRLEPAPGQWSPVPKVGKRDVDHKDNWISVRMEYPDVAKNRKGFNPIDYPDLEFSYTLYAVADGRSFHIVVDLDSPLPPDWVGRVGLNLELYPGYLFGKTYCIGDHFGVFPRQPSGVRCRSLGDLNQIEPIARGAKLVVAPESDLQRMTIVSADGSELQLIDGRQAHNNGWFVVRSLIAEGATQGAIDWLITPHAVPDFCTEPTVQVSQVGYHPAQPKIAIVELDKHDQPLDRAELIRISESGDHEIALRAKLVDWGEFLRFRYLKFDFTSVKKPGMFVVRYGETETAPFKIAADVFAEGVWQPTVEYFLPVQMCHMRVNENYRVWHGECHMDDARMAPIHFNHIDGYIQGSSTLTPFEPNEHVPGLAVGGWHDAGDYDIRIESQADTVHGLALAYEEFGLTYDNTTVDQATRVVELLRPDGKPDILQQIEHGCLSIVAGYKTLGRLYRGLIEPTLRQYTHLGDAATVTDNSVGGEDDRWVFTEHHPQRELGAAGALAAAARVLRGFNDCLADDCIRIAVALFDDTETPTFADQIEAAVELLKSTGEDRYKTLILSKRDTICEAPELYGWYAARALPMLHDEAFEAELLAALEKVKCSQRERNGKTPYDLPYTPNIWGAGWTLQRYGVQQYWLNKHCPSLFDDEGVLNVVNFVLGCHPGSNTASFVSGVGAKSMIPGYGVNRAEFSYIPGGIGSGTALIRPDYPELLEWPFLWQQTEYCVGYPTSDFVFLIAAADHLLNREPV